MEALSEQLGGLEFAEDPKRVARSSTKVTTETFDTDIISPVKIPCPRTTIGAILSRCIPPYIGLAHQESTHDSSRANLSFPAFLPRYFSPVPETQRTKILREVQANQTVVQFSPDKDVPNFVKQFENENTLSEILGKHINDIHDAVYEEYFKGSTTYRLRQSSEVRYKYIKRFQTI
jgi:hypothetical protein